jgi:hypothetical protein
VRSRWHDLTRQPSEPVEGVVLGFATAIVIGTLLLMLPISAEGPRGIVAPRRHVHLDVGPLCDRAGRGRHGDILHAVRAGPHPAMPDTVLTEGDVLVVAGEPRKAEEFASLD